MRTGPTQIDGGTENFVVTALDAFFNHKIGRHPPTFIKIDIEGGGTPPSRHSIKQNVWFSADRRRECCRKEIQSDVRPAGRADLR